MVPFCHFPCYITSCIQLNLMAGYFSTRIIFVNDKGVGGGLEAGGGGARISTFLGPLVPRRGSWMGRQGVQGVASILLTPHYKQTGINKHNRY